MNKLKTTLVAWTALLVPSLTPTDAIAFDTKTAIIWAWVWMFLWSTFKNDKSTEWCSWWYVAVNYGWRNVCMPPAQTSFPQGDPSTRGPTYWYSNNMANYQANKPQSYKVIVRDAPPPVINEERNQPVEQIIVEEKPEVEVREIHVTKPDEPKKECHLTDVWNKDWYPTKAKVCTDEKWNPVIEAKK